jgi:hypothetical protein
MRITGSIIQGGFEICEHEKEGDEGHETNSSVQKETIDYGARHGDSCVFDLF